MLQESIKKGLSFGLTSSIITTLGLMVGLHSGTHSQIVVLGAILTIAVADSLSDALGVHISEESENTHSEKQIWEATLSTLFAKFAFAITFALPVLLLPLEEAIMVSVVWGFSLLAVVSYVIAREQKKSAWKVVGEHLGIAVAVIIIAHYLGIWIAATFV